MNSSQNIRILGNRNQTNSTSDTHYRLRGGQTGNRRKFSWWPYGKMLGVPTTRIANET